MPPSIPNNPLGTYSQSSSVSSSMEHYRDMEDEESKKQLEHKADARFEVYDPAAGDSDIEDARPASRKRPPHSLWARGLAAVSPLIASTGKPADAHPFLSFRGTHSKVFRPRWFRKANRSCCLMYLVVGFFTMLGIVQFISLACGVVISFFPDEIDRATDRWRQNPSATSPNTNRWPTDVSRDIFAVGCHSHNDYWRRIPLYSALQAGCVGVEADVWLFDNELYVGHTTSSLTPSRTLKSLYIDPLMEILARQNPITPFHPTLDHPPNGVFDTDPSQSLILLIDFKTDGEETWEYVYAQLAPFRERGYLTYFDGTGIVNGPITVVGTGNAPFNLVTANNTYRDIFFDAPLDLMADETDNRDADAAHEERGDNAGQGLSGLSPGDLESTTFNMTNSYYASVSFKKSIGFPWMFRLSESQMSLIRAQIAGAHRRGLKVRYWGTPNWPRSLRNHIWEILVREGVDMLNVDDLQSATRKEWVPRISDWWT
ncbi:hypothetical protein AOCH_004141 [Aspergillus ochraceoroseus]|uniref:Altered inheritance of mitochondria protein 6 n=2 Tax=Aspergillus ochraceoroseus TaxID=138278 RepID=A0A0F8UVP0_9EURO|nr:hypothetical protein AOCH_004141 [Aspergillus ochraceoroseus]